ncbi:MAG: CidB/LrgB family autolysis modulator [Lonepinella koalarum]|nr:CidB/LrgB family autolysis modulator [Lonepinella koalarum]
MIYLYSILTLAVFFIAMQISKRLKSVLLNTFILTVLLLILVVLLGKIPYVDYMTGNTPLTNLLGLSVVALALPLYEQLRPIAAYWKSILLMTTLTSFFAMASGAGLALWLGANPKIVATVISKSVTTPIAMAMSENLGGVPAVAAIGVILAGLQGSLLGYIILKKIGLKRSESMGLAIGAVSHALGTVSVMEQDRKAGTYSSISLVLCGIISSVLAPLVFKLLYMVA